MSGGDMPMWKGLFEWSMKYQDGTGGGRSAQPLSTTDQQWLEEALKGAMLDLSNRMADINTALSDQPAATISEDSPSAPEPATLEEKEQMLDELMEIVESIDEAKNLGAVGGLPTLINLLGSSHPSLQWRAAEVVATCVQNNPEVQDAFLAGGVLPALWPMLDNSVVMCQIKAMLALSCQIRGHVPSLRWFRNQDGVNKLIQVLDGPDSRLQRKCLQILEYYFQTVPLDKEAACTPLLPLLTQVVSESEDGDVRCAALGVMQRLADDEKCLRKLQDDQALVSVVQAVQCKLDTLPEEDWGTAEDEARLAKDLMGDLSKKLPAVEDENEGHGGSGSGGEDEEDEEEDEYEDITSDDDEEDDEEVAARPSPPWTRLMAKRSAEQSIGKKKARNHPSKRSRN